MNILVQWNITHPRDYHTKSVRYRKMNIIGYYLYVESKKKWYKWTYTQTRNRFTDIENKFDVTKGKKGMGRDKLGVWD